MKLIISLFLFILISCDNISKDKILSKVENTKNVIEEKAKKSIKKSDDLKKENLSKNKIFYLIGDPYYIEGVKYTPNENYSYEEVGLATYYDKDLHNQKTLKSH